MMAKIGNLLVAFVFGFLVVNTSAVTECDTLCNNDAGAVCSNIFSTVTIDNQKADSAALFLVCCLGSESAIHYKFNYIKNSLFPETVIGIFRNVDSEFTAKRFAVFVRNCSKGGRRLTWSDWYRYYVGIMYCEENPCPSP